MRTLLFLLLVSFSTVSFAHKHHHHYHHYGYGYTNFYFEPGPAYERDVVRVRGGYLVERYYPKVYYWPYRTRVHYNYGPRYWYARDYYWW